MIMNKYLRKLGFRNSDELEMKITIKSIKWSWVYTMAFLAIWSVFSAIDKNEIPMIQVVLILTGELLFFGLQWIFAKQAIKEDESAHSDSKRLSQKGKDSYEYVYEDEDGTQYIYEEVEVDE